MARIARPWYAADKGCYFAYVKGRRVRLLKGEENAANEKLATAELKKVLKGTKNDSAPGSLRVADVIERYLTLHQSKYSKAALENRRRYLQLFAETHGWQKVNDRDCLPVHVEEWIAAHPEWASDWTKAHLVSIIMRPFNWAAKKRIIPSNPFRGVEQAEGDPRRPLTDDEFQALLRNATVWTKRKRSASRYPSGRKVCPSDRKHQQRPSSAARFRQVLVCLRFTGMRPGELARLEWPDIDLANQVIILRNHKTKKKTKKPRVIQLDPVVVKLLIVVRRYGQPGERVFLSQRKTPWTKNSLDLRVRRARQAAGIADDAKLYGLRHAFGIRAIINKVDIKTLAELMGHQSTRTTEHYLTYLGGERSHLADAMRRVNARRPAS